MDTSTHNLTTPTIPKGISPLPTFTFLPQTRTALREAARANDERRRYHMRVTAGGVSEDRYVSERSKDFLMEMGRQHGSWAHIEVLGVTGPAREPVDIGAYRARKAARLPDNGSFLEKMAMSPLVWPGGKGPRFGAIGPLK